MTELGSGWTTAAIIVAVALLVHEPWRWLGLKVGRDLDIDGELFRWVRAVATAMVAGLVMRLLVFPAGALVTVPLTLRLVAFVAGIAVFFAARRNLALGVAGGIVALMLGRLVLA
jgi:hypothetical protein